MPWLRLEGLSLSFGDDDVIRLCAPFGVVIQASIARLPDGTAMGFCHVEMATITAAEAVRQALDGRHVRDHLITVRHVPREEEPTQDTPRCGKTGTGGSRP